MDHPQPLTETDLDEIEAEAMNNARTWDCTLRGGDMRRYVGRGFNGARRVYWFVLWSLVVTVTMALTAPTTHGDDEAERYLKRMEERTNARIKAMTKDLRLATPAERKGIASALPKCSQLDSAVYDKGEDIYDVICATGEIYRVQFNEEGKASVERVEPLPSRKALEVREVSAVEEEHALSVIERDHGDVCQFVARAVTKTTSPAQNILVECTSDRFFEVLFVRDAGSEATELKEWSAPWLKDQ